MTQGTLSMNEQQLTDIILKITSELSALNQNMKSTLDRLANHENRLVELEKNNTKTFKEEIVQWLVKGLLISLGIIASLTGSGAILKNIFQVQQPVQQTVPTSQQ